LAYLQQVHPETPLSNITKEDEDDEARISFFLLLKYYNQNTDEDHSNNDDDDTSKGPTNFTLAPPSALMQEPCLPPSQGGSGEATNDLNLEPMKTDTTKPT
jgi:hypothetical protein